MPQRYHFSGIAGAGMNPLAQLMRAWGHEVQGSDRSIDQGKNPELAGPPARPGHHPAAPGWRGDHCRHHALHLLRRGRAGHSGDACCARARLEIMPRPALLAEVVDRAVPGVAVAGTSGKSTVTGMITWILRQAGVQATILGGAALAGEGGAGRLHRWRCRERPWSPRPANPMAPWSATIPPSA
jgi:UDP-N-acetylmuramate--alanine ligase